MLHAVIEGVLALIAEFLISLLWWFILFPVVWLVSLPFILVIALFRRGPYSRSVAEMLASVHHHWKEWGIMVVP